MCRLLMEISCALQVSFDRNIVQYYGCCLEEPPFLLTEYCAVRSFTDSRLAQTRMRPWKVSTFHPCVCIWSTISLHSLPKDCTS